MLETFLDGSASRFAWAAEASGNKILGTNGERCEALRDVCAERWLRPFLPRV
jgi:hypothetical protein